MSTSFWEEIIVLEKFRGMAKRKKIELNQEFGLQKGGWFIEGIDATLQHELDKFFSVIEEEDVEKIIEFGVRKIVMAFTMSATIMAMIVERGTKASDKFLAARYVLEIVGNIRFVNGMNKLLDLTIGDNKKERKPSVAPAELEKIPVDWGRENPS